MPIAEMMVAKTFLSQSLRESTSRTLMKEIHVWHQSLRLHIEALKSSVAGCAVQETVSSHTLLGLDHQHVLGLRPRSIHMQYS